MTYTILWGFTFLAFGIVVFSWGNATHYGSQWFAPKRFVTPHQTPPRSKILPKDNNGNVLNRPWYYFDWIRGLWMLSEEEILQYGGYDVVMFLRTVQMFFWVFAYFSPYAFFVILPLNLSCRATGDGDGGREFYRTTVTNCLSLASASEGGDRYKSLLFAHYIGLVLLQAILLFCVFSTNLGARELRRRYCKDMAFRQSTTVLVRNLPAKLRSKVAVTEYFNTLYSNSVESVEMLKYIPALERSVERRDALVFRLERAYLRNFGNDRNPAVVKLEGLLDDANQQLTDLNETILRHDELIERIAGHALSVIKDDTFVNRASSFDDTIVPGEGAVKRRSKTTTELPDYALAPADQRLTSRGPGSTPFDFVSAPIYRSHSMDSEGLPKSVSFGSSISSKEFSPVVELERRSSNDCIDMEEEEEVEDDSPPLFSQWTNSYDSKNFKLAGQLQSSNRTRLSTVGSVSSSAWSSGADSRSAAVRLSIAPDESYDSQRHSSGRGGRYELGAEAAEEGLATRYWRNIWGHPGLQPFWKERANKQTEEGHVSCTPPVVGQAMDYLRARIVDAPRETREHWNNVAKEQGNEELKEKQGINLAYAFVTFRDITSMTLATQVVHSVDKHRQIMTVEPAPDPADIFWGNLGAARQKYIKRFISEILVFVVNVFFIIPVAWLNRFLGTNAINGWNMPDSIKSVAHYLLPLILMILSNLLPPLFTGLGFFEGCITWSQNGERQLDRFFGYLTLNVFAVSLLSGTIFQTVGELVDQSPTEYIESIALTIPKLSAFFTQYMILKAFMSLSVELCRGLTVFHMICRFLFCVSDKTKRERDQVIIGIRRWNNPGWLPYGKQLAHLLLALCIGLSFVCLAPLIIIPTMLYALFGQVVYRQTLLFHYEPRFETGGRFWPRTLKWIIRVMLVSQFIQLCIFVLVQNLSVAGLTLLLMIVTVWLHSRVFLASEQDLTRLPLEIAFHYDFEFQQGRSLRRPTFLSHCYHEHGHLKKDLVRAEQPPVVEKRPILPCRTPPSVPTNASLVNKFKTKVQLTFADPAELLYQSGFVLDHKRIIVLQVVDGSQAAEQGLRLGARLTEFMGKVIKNRDDFNEAMHHVKLSDETEPLQLTFLQKQLYRQPTLVAATHQATLAAIVHKAKEDGNRDFAGALASRSLPRFLRTDLEAHGWKVVDPSMDPNQIPDHHDPNVAIDVYGATLAESKHGYWSTDRVDGACFYRCHSCFRTLCWKCSGAAPGRTSSQAEMKLQLASGSSANFVDVGIRMELNASPLRHPDARSELGV